MTALSRTLLGLVTLVLVGCTALPPLPPAVATYAPTDSAETPLGRIARASLGHQAADVSGFELLPTSVHAFDARLALIVAATRTLDLQYHEFKDDRSGARIMLALIDAAGRGVRVRVLIDDLLTTGEDPVLQSLAFHDNLEVRVFNPYAPPRNAGWTRALSSIGSGDRLDRRMHNKLLVADNAVAVSGGRNIADEYLLNGQGGGLIDVDLLSAGPVVPQLSATFDRYWNSSVAYPIGAIAMPRLTAAEADRAFDERVNQITAAPAPAASRSAQALSRRPSLPTAGTASVAATPDGSDPAIASGAGPASSPGSGATSTNSGLPSPLTLAAVSQQLASGQLTLVYGTARATADAPDKVLGTRGDTPLRPVSTVVSALYQTREEILIATPYLIPGAAGIAAMRQALDRGAHVKVVTNSLASTDEPMIHQAYSLYRRDLLQYGAQIFELSSTVSGASSRQEDLTGQGRLQSRITVVDRSRVYFGSMNLDGRSARVNTELGLQIDSPALARQVLDLFFERHGDDMYEVRLTPDRRDLQWIGRRSGVETIYTREPEATWYARTRLWLSSPFISEDLL